MPVPCGNGEILEAFAVTETGDVATADDAAPELLALDVDGCAEIDVGAPTSPISSITSKKIARRNTVTDAT